LDTQRLVLEVLRRLLILQLVFRGFLRRASGPRLLDDLPLGVSRLHDRFSQTLRARTLRQSLAIRYAASFFDGVWSEACSVYRPRGFQTQRRLLQLLLLLNQILLFLFGLFLLLLKALLV